jgi:hypothetical protein
MTIDINDFIKALHVKKFVVRHCSLCNYPLNYFAIDNIIYLDTGCYCVTYCPRVTQVRIEDIIMFFDTESIISFILSRQAKE